MSLGGSLGVLEARIQGSTSPASGKCRQMRSPYPVWPAGQAAKEGRVRSSPKERTTMAAWQVDAVPNGRHL